MFILTLIRGKNKDNKIRRGDISPFFEGNRFCKRSGYESVLESVKACNAYQTSIIGDRSIGSVFLYLYITI